MSRSMSRAGGDLAERCARLQQEIDDFTRKHGVDDRAQRIMLNLHPTDVKNVMATPFPTECRNTTAFVVSTIRKVEKEARRPQSYRWDGKTWSEPRIAPRGLDRGRGGGGGRLDSRSRTRGGCGYDGGGDRGRRRSPRGRGGRCRSRSIRGSGRSRPRRRNTRDVRERRQRRREERGRRRARTTKGRSRDRGRHGRRGGGRRRDSPESEYSYYSSYYSD
eukprot:TRINITY_DN48770_c0_g1_i1.p1 TRINITY_DN48770_c0_g1~~TRINITY_DN48770_c0_g1_i1.p1  ORF type:complete len:219 (-),score=24.10 TRINITY_DN48770_c0_g1_i1:209-865(-)